MDGTLAHIIDTNRGFFTRAEALDCGETDRTLAEAVRGGEIVRLRRGAYAPAALFRACDPAGQHLLHARSVLATQRGPVALTGPSAAALHGFALYDQNLTDVHLLRLDSRASRREARVAHHVSTGDLATQVELYDGVLAITPARAVWEVACHSSLEGGVVTADSAMHLDRALIGPIRELSSTFAYVPGSRTARIAVRLAHPDADSPGESVTRVQCYRHSIPCPSLQHHVYDDGGRLIGIADFWWEEYRHLGEFDGKVKYERYLREGESAADAVVREKKREDDMRAGLRGMSRFTWGSVMPGQSHRTMAELKQALEQSRRLYVVGRIAG